MAHHEPHVQAPITVRNLKLGAQSLGDSRWYVNRDPVATAFYNALTIVFPPGERFFIESVRPFMASAPGPLKSEIRDFVRQEALHTREHEAFNAQVENSGYEASRVSARARAALGQYDDAPAIERLAITASLEHFTAIFAHEILTEDHHLRETPHDCVRLWRWHALEEIEHKAVAFDTLEWAMRDWSAPRRWWFRTIAMLNATWMFATTTSANMDDLLAQDGLSGFAMQRRKLGYLFGRKGVARAMAKGWFGWFSPRFHPWQHDNSALVARTAAEFA
ncbi:metal-dependent hydrolase [Qipengyuania sp. XHP0207]|uniref:metal-dependent hydrolase n=1 Tax=Qipengyuania sp. XHP0207 TaxID=3038078 RepID=UPI00241CB740|nr:metal-dependent hydrolase [Qipengyuania sp. XHP0207]MDG5746734.1 metal-dependent hydrolase [Qipengyuania sp. XHP0207]